MVPACCRVLREDRGEYGMASTRAGARLCHNPEARPGRWKSATAGDILRGGGVGVGVGRCAQSLPEHEVRDVVGPQTDALRPVGHRDPLGPQALQHRAEDPRLLIGQSAPRLARVESS